MKSMFTALWILSCGASEQVPCPGDGLSILDGSGSRVLRLGCMACADSGCDAVREGGPAAPLTFLYRDGEALPADLPRTPSLPDLAAWDGDRYLKSRRTPPPDEVRLRAGWRQRPARFAMHGPDLLFMAPQLEDGNLEDGERIWEMHRLRRLEDGNFMLSEFTALALAPRTRHGFGRVTPVPPALRRTLLDMDGRDPPRHRIRKAADWNRHICRPMPDGPDWDSLVEAWWRR